MESGKCLRVLSGHTGRLNKVVLSEDGRVAVTASDDGTARVWRLSDGACLHVRPPFTRYKSKRGLVSPAASPSAVQCCAAPTAHAPLVHRILSHTAQCLPLRISHQTLKYMSNRKM